MSNVELWYSVKDKLKELQKPFISVGVTLFDSLNHNYPHIKEDKFFFMDNNPEMDNISGDNFKKFLQNMNIFVKKLSKLLPKEMKPISKKARMNYEYLTNYENTEKVTYYPVTIEFDDGQYLIGLARQYGDNAKKVTLNRDDKLKVVKWLLNGVDITKEVYQNVSGKIDKSLFNVELSALAKKIASIIEKNHTQWIKANPQASINTDKEIKQEIKKVKKEIAELQKQKDELIKQIEAKKAQENEKEPIDEEPQPQKELEANQENDEDKQKKEKSKYFNEFLETLTPSYAGKAKKVLEKAIKMNGEYYSTTREAIEDYMFNKGYKAEEYKDFGIVLKSPNDSFFTLDTKAEQKYAEFLQNKIDNKEINKKQTSENKPQKTKTEPAKKEEAPTQDIKSQAQELLQQIKEAGEDLDKIEPLIEELEKMYDENPNELKDEYEEANNILNKIAGV